MEALVLERVKGFLVTVRVKEGLWSCSGVSWK